MKSDTIKVIHGTENDKAWAMLRKYLDKFDKKEITLCRYRAVVLRTILTVNAYASIPEWLTSFYKVINYHHIIYFSFMWYDPNNTSLLFFFKKKDI